MYKDRIEEYFDTHKEEMLEDISKLIRINSIKGEAKEGMPFGEGPAKALEEALKIADGMGFKTKNYDNYVGTVDLNDKEKGLDILGHLDVVPVSDEWTITGPFEPLIQDGKLYGRGSSDDKGPSVAALYALKAVKDLNIPLSKNARLILGTDEESGSGKELEHYYGIEKEAPMTFSPDAEFPVINIEKGGFKPTFKASFKEDEKLPRIISIDSGVKINVVPDKAYAVIEGMEKDEVEQYCKKKLEGTDATYKVDEKEDKVNLFIRGVGAHAASPEEGNNALTLIIDILTSMPFADSEGFTKLKAVNELLPHGDYNGRNLGISLKDEISGELTLSFTIFKYTLDFIEGRFDVRSPICATKENMIDVAVRSFKDKGFDLIDTKMNPPHHVDENSEFIKILLNCYEKYTDQKGKCLAIGGGTYVHEIENGVAFGCSMPGTNNNMHGDNEFAVIDELVTSAKIFTEAIIQICK